MDCLFDLKLVGYSFEALKRFYDLFKLMKSLAMPAKSVKLASSS